jgi:predicted transcriptional regulator
MAAYTTIADWTAVEDGYVVAVTVRKTEAETYPSGWDYSLHLGEIGGETILRYDNAHERAKGHERHDRDGVETIDFPGMVALYDRFKREVEDRSPGTGRSKRPPGGTQMSTLKVTVGDRDRLDKQTRHRIAAASEGDDLGDAQPVLNFETYAELNRLLRPKNLELLEVIAQQDPESIRATAELVGRDYKQVHRNLGELEDIGVVEFESVGPGNARRPTLAYDGLEVDIPFTDSDGSADTAAP